MMKHSPTPWKAVFRHGSPDYHLIVDANGHKIAEVYGETNDNAYLIESVPEMLELISEIAHSVTIDSTYTEWAQKLLAKVTGEAGEGV